MTGNGQEYRQGYGEEYRKTATVFARRLSGQERVRIETLEGPSIGEPGDWVLTANTERAEQWICRDEVFSATYVPVGTAGEFTEYRKTSTVLARQLQSGNWLLTARGEEWVCPREVFAETYVPVNSGATEEDIGRAVSALVRAGHEVPPFSTIGRIIDSYIDQARSTPEPAPSSLETP